MKLSSEIMNIQVSRANAGCSDYVIGHHDARHAAAEIAEQREAELLDQIRRLRAVIDEMPGRVVPLELVNIFDDKDVVIKNALLKKHGVEV